MPPDIFIYLLIIAAVIVVLSLFFSFVPVGLWISAAAAGVKVGIFNLIGMRLRRVVPTRVVNPMIKATKAGLNISINQLVRRISWPAATSPRCQRPDRPPSGLTSIWASNGPPPSTWPAAMSWKPSR
jgi:hypothetical protein